MTPTETALTATRSALESLNAGNMQAATVALETALKAAYAAQILAPMRLPVPATGTEARDHVWVNGGAA